MRAILDQAYSYIFEEALLDEIAKVAIYKEFKADDYLIEIGDYIKTMPLLLTGAIKILREDENGDELLLYFLERGDTCAMTLTCCMGQSKSRIRAIAETDGAMLMIPVEKMEEWLTKYKTWRNFVFDSYNVRLNEMLEAIDTLAFMNLDERLYKYLTDKAKVIGDTEIKNTHQEIAYEMHTSRVVISRLLKALELQGKIKLHRNKIEILQF
ncbi:Crp/Fnr family transcriptional regulator [Flavobacterium cucumis]|jgi:CRP/FNR family transcriptional regulator, anaerobic regulatory protein|uniref:CRP/FNR family transcriptional regulator, anaerobic regulatory protein n=3 Tax=Flavobacterium TaxID=237 RepID=A0A1M7ZY07_9FLAO|nr:MULTISPECIES: Crp/Fnr family transcriptional regulator [Flavobacterium]MBE9577560.1 Crp/Fnr family transcriptional regulator [Flavobacterium proteolyticum]MBV2196532.1 Crp/Fnr family transcriptional regulator [Flavobacterium sp.]MCA1965994.1 Crp/Fnr family transcriptional regulator [Flavobacterium sp.]MCD8518652.1 Crp/Fnr family transcriptional regulator [Flavobacterium sp.]MCK6608005.1 Crp/Fnr family transcriptional regulator [Flavobacterium sp.]